MALHSLYSADAPLRNCSHTFKTAAVTSAGRRAAR